MNRDGDDVDCVSRFWLEWLSLFQCKSFACTLY